MKHWLMVATLVFPWSLLIGSAAWLLSAYHRLGNPKPDADGFVGVETPDGYVMKVKRLDGPPGEIRIDKAHLSRQQFRGTRRQRRRKARAAARDAAKALHV